MVAGRCGRLQLCAPAQSGRLVGFRRSRLEDTGHRAGRGNGGVAAVDCMDTEPCRTGFAIRRTRRARGATSTGAWRAPACRARRTKGCSRIANGWRRASPLRPRISLHWRASIPCCGLGHRRNGERCRISCARRGALGAAVWSNAVPPGLLEPVRVTARPTAPQCSSGSPQLRTRPVSICTKSDTRYKPTPPFACWRATRASRLVSTPATRTSIA